MSTRHIPYPPDFDIDHAAAHHEERRRLALQRLDAGDVIAAVEDLVSGLTDPQSHPLAAPVAYFLARGTHHGSRYWARESFVAAWEALIHQAIDALVEARLQDPHAWED